MAEFFNVLPPDAARDLLLTSVPVAISAEMVATADALGRTTAEVVRAPHALPQFRRSTMDGYAVRAADTFGASESLPALVRVIGEVAMGQAATLTLGEGEAALVHTGGMLPDSAEAVIQVEWTQRLLPDAGGFPYEIELLKPVAVGQNVLQVGEDVALDSAVVEQGHTLRPQDLGGLMALGITTVAVAKRPRVAILATGDEVVAPNSAVGPGQVRDINSTTLAAMVQQAGGEPRLIGIAPDDFEQLLAMAREALASAEMLVLSAGSSVSVRDMTAAVVDALGAPGVLFHGVATRPGKPTIAGVADGKPVLGLPGNPVSAMVQFGMLGVPLIRHLQGVARPSFSRRLTAVLTENVASESGREDYVPARLSLGEPGWLATPVFGKSNLIFTLVRADGLIKVPLNVGGLLAGDSAEVELF